VGPARSYVICCVQRTGSWLLAHTLADTGYAGRPSDYFDDAEQENHTPVRYRKQADSLTERYIDLVRSAMSSRSA
jgi:LPS sulfotransferase NodH